MTDKHQLIAELSRLSDQMKTCATLMKNIYGKDAENAAQLMDARKMARSWAAAIRKEKP